MGIRAVGIVGTGGPWAVRSLDERLDPSSAAPPAAARCGLGDLKVRSDRLPALPRRLRAGAPAPPLMTRAATFPRSPSGVPLRLDDATDADRRF